MSFYTALTGLNGSQADISATSNNIANVGTTGFKRSVAEFGDIFATSPLQNSSSSIGSGTILKGIKQQFTQGNISSSLNALDLAISGQGFFALKPSLTSAQTVYTRNGSLNVDNDRYVVDSAGQYLLTYPVNADGSVTAKDLDSAVPLQLPVTSGDPRATSNISLGVNVPAAADVVTDRPEFEDGYSFDPEDPNTFTNSTSITIFDDLGNPTIATMYFIKTQASTADDPTNKFDTRLVIDGNVIEPDLVPSVNDSGSQIFVDRFGRQTTEVPDDTYFLEGKGSKLYKLDDLQELRPSEPAKLTGEQTEFDFGEEGDRLVEIVTDPMQFKATRESGDGNSRVYWGKNFLTVNVDNGDQPVNIDLRPGKYNAEQLAAEVERAINAAYGDDSKIQVVQNVDDTLNINLFKLNQDGSSSGLTTPISVDLLGDSYVSDVEGITLTGASPDFTQEQFLAHVQARINDSLNDYAVARSDGDIENANALGVSGSLFARSTGAQMNNILESTQIVTFEHRTFSDGNSDDLVNGDDVADANMTVSDKHMVYSYYGKRPSLSVYDQKTQVNSTGNTVVYNATENTLRIYFASDPTNISQNEKIRIAGDFAATETNAAMINGREFTVNNKVSTTTPVSHYIEINTTGLDFPDDGFTMTETDLFVMSDESEDVEAFFEGEANVYEGAEVNFNSKKIVLRETGDAVKHGYTEKQVLNRTGGVSSSTLVSGVVPTGTTAAGLTNTSGHASSATSVVVPVGDITSSGAGAGMQVTVNFDGAAPNANVTNVDITNAGVGYQPGDTITISNANSNPPLATNITFTIPAEQPVNLAAFDVPATAITGGAGTGMTARVSTDANGVPSVVLSGGTGYAIGDTLTIASASNGLSADIQVTVTGLNSDGIFNVKGAEFDIDQNVGTVATDSLSILGISTGTLENFTITSGGFGHPASSTLTPATITPPAGVTGVTASVVTDANGIPQVTLTGGTGFKVGDTVTLSGGGLGGPIVVTVNSVSDSMGTTTDWVDEKNPPIKVSYDAVNQRLEYTVERNILGTGTNSNFNSFSIYGSDAADDTNNLGIPSKGDADEVLIRGGEVLSMESFVADGEEIQLNDKRYGISVNYNSDTRSFTFASGTTGEAIEADEALGVSEDQSASAITVGRYNLSTVDGSVIDTTDYFSGDNHLIAVGDSKTDVTIDPPRGLASSPAIATGATAREDLTEVFRLSSTDGENIFNVSVNGINGVIEVPSGFYVGTTLAEALEKRINQISDSETGRTVGGVTVRYSSDTNNFVFETGTTGEDSTIKVKGASRLGLDDVPLGVGSVPEVYNLVQATNENDELLFVDAEGNLTTTPPDDMVDNYYPLYIDEGELTFDKTGKLVSPKNKVHYESASAGVSVDLNIDFSESTQFAQPFSVLSVEQDGFTSGRLDGLEIDASGTVRANYTNGQNDPLGKIVLANFNNQNGLKQIGNATYVATAVSGDAQVGEAGAEGFGNILSGSLERSNVDITEELVNLITAQRNFQASAKAIETTTTLTQTIIQIRG